MSGQEISADEVARKTLRVMACDLRPGDVIADGRTVRSTHGPGHVNAWFTDGSWEGYSSSEMIVVTR